MSCFASKNVLSVAHFVDDAELKNGVLLSDYIRNETLNRLRAMPSYDCKSLKWKNIYYDYFKRQVIKEIEKEIKNNE